MVFVRDDDDKSSFVVDKGIPASLREKDGKTYGLIACQLLYVLKGTRGIRAVSRLRRLRNRGLQAVARLFVRPRAPLRHVPSVACRAAWPQVVALVCQVSFSCACCKARLFAEGSAGAAQVVGGLPGDKLEVVKSRDGGVVVVRASLVIGARLETPCAQLQLLHAIESKDRPGNEAMLLGFGNTADQLFGLASCLEPGLVCEYLEKCAC